MRMAPPSNGIGGASCAGIRPEDRIIKKTEAKFNLAHEMAIRAGAIVIPIINPGGRKLIRTGNKKANIRLISKIEICGKFLTFKKSNL